MANRNAIPPTPVPGSRKGKPNKISKELKEMIRGALDDAGGQEYLVAQAKENPTAFLTLLGKILPKDINANVKGKVTLKLFDFDVDI